MQETRTKKQDTRRTSYMVNKEQDQDNGIYCLITRIPDNDDGLFAKKI